MHDRPKSTLPSPLDLYSEATRRALYDSIAEEYFAPKPSPPIDAEDFIETCSAV